MTDLNWVNRALVATSPEERSVVERQALTWTDEAADLIQIELAHMFHVRQGQDSRLAYPEIQQPIVALPHYAVFVMNPHSLDPFELKKLMDQDTLDKLGMAVQGRVRAVKVLPPIVPGDRPLRGLFYIVDLHEIPTNEGGPTGLPAVARLNLAERPEGKLMVPFGKVFRNDELVDFWLPAKKVQHMLIAGESGSGKSNFLHAALIGVLYGTTPDEIRIAIISPKKAEFAAWSAVPHNLFPDHIAQDVPQASKVIKSLLSEFSRRDRIFTQAGVRNLDDYNAQAFKPEPTIIAVLDETLDLAMQSKRSGLMEDLASLISKCRSHGIFIWLAATYPRFDVVPKTISSNQDTRVGFRVINAETAKAIMCPGADLLTEPGQAIIRARGIFQMQAFLVTDDEIAAATARLAGKPVEDLRAGATRLAQDEAGLVVYAVERLGGAFTIGELAAAFKGTKWTANQLRQKARQWESDDWLTSQLADGRGRAGTRRVKQELADLAYFSLGRASVRVPNTPTGAGSADESVDGVVESVDAPVAA